MAIVYMATNLVNGKRYIGVTKGTLANRRYFHFSDARRGRKKIFSRAIRKHGAEAFQWRVMHDYLFPEDAVAAEVRFISSLKPEYNMTAGGDGTQGLVMSEESRAKMRAAYTPARRAKARETILKSLTPERRARSAETLRKKLTGVPNHGTALRNKSKEHAERARIQGIAQKDAFVARCKGIPKGNERVVVCLTDGMEFPSASAAARHYGASKSQLIELCGGKKNRLTCKGKTFKYKEVGDGPST